MTITTDENPEVLCEFCGGQMIFAEPIDYYCPNDACTPLYQAQMRDMIRQMQENRERAEYLRLKKKFEGE